MTQPIEHLLAERARNQTAMTVLQLKLQEESIRWEAVTALGCRRENEAADAIRQQLTPATLEEIIRSLQEIERIKGKAYPKTPAYANIHDTLHQARISRALLAVWQRETLRTTYCSGNRYQPLPTHDEAWQTYSRVHTDTLPQRYAAETLRYRTKPVKITNGELVQAAEWGFWDDMPLSLQRRLYQMLPAGKRQEIYATCTADEAMQQTRKHYDKTYV